MCKKYDFFFNYRGFLQFFNVTDVKECVNVGMCKCVSFLVWGFVIWMCLLVNALIRKSISTLTRGVSVLQLLQLKMTFPGVGIGEMEL